MLDELTRVKTRDGRFGTVMIVYNDGEAYEVEFSHAYVNGFTYSTVETLEATEVEAVPDATP